MRIKLTKMQKLFACVDACNQLFNVLATPEGKLKKLDCNVNQKFQYEETADGKEQAWPFSKIG